MTRRSKFFILVFLLLFVPAVCCPAELLVKATDHTCKDPIEDRRGAYKRGMVVEVREDGAEYGKQERLPKFVVIKIPGVPKEKVQKYMEEHRINVGTKDEEVYRRRRWKIRLDDMPLAARQSLEACGRLTIKALPTYTGTANMTWADAKQYFRNLETGEDETEDLDK